MNRKYVIVRSNSTSGAYTVERNTDAPNVCSSKADIAGYASTIREAEARARDANLRKTEYVDEQDRHLRNTSAGEWHVYFSRKDAKQYADNPAHSPCLAEWRGGFITAPKGHPIPHDALIVERQVCNKWRKISP